MALSGEPDPTNGYVTCTKLKEDNVKSGDPLSSNLSKTSDLVKEEVHRLREISERMKETEASDIDMLLKALKPEKSQYTSWDHNDGPTTMIYDIDLGWIDEPLGPMTRYWKRITQTGENRSLTTTSIRTEVK